MKSIDFPDQYIRENLTLQEVLAVPGVMELVRRAKWDAIQEAHDLATADLDIFNK